MDTPEIDGVKKLTLPFTTCTDLMTAYKKRLDEEENPQPKPRDTYQEVYATLTPNQRQAMSNAENTVFEVTRRAKILLEHEQRELENIHEDETQNVNLPFKPLPEEITTKFDETITEYEQDVITAGLNVKTQFDNAVQLISKEIRAEHQAKKEEEMIK